MKPNIEYGKIEKKTDCMLYNNAERGKEMCKGLKKLYCKEEKCNP